MTEEGLLKIIILIIAIFSFFLQAQDTLLDNRGSLQLSPDTNRLSVTIQPVDIDKTIPPDGRQFLATGYCFVGTGVLSLACAAAFYAAYQNKPAMGDPPDTNGVQEEKDPKLKRYATMFLWTGLACGVSSSPFLVIGYKKRKAHNDFLDRHINSFRDGTFTVEVSFAF